MNKDNFAPSATVETKLIVDIRPITDDTKDVQVEVVVDFNLYSEPVAVEILNLYCQTGPNVLDGLEEILESAGMGMSYDPENDIFYMKIVGDSSSDSRPSEATATLDSGGRLIRMVIPLL